MVTLTYGNVKTHVSSDDALERKAVFHILDERLAYQKDGYWFSPAYQMGGWDGKQHFFSVKTGLLYSGFVSRAIQLLTREQVPFQLVGYPEQHLVTSDFLSLPNIILPDGTECYTHQSHAVRQVQRFSRGIVKIAPNGGKTEVAAAVIHVFDYPPSVIYVPRALLVNQIASRLEKRLLRPVGRVGAGFDEPMPDGITVAMTHTTSDRFKQLTKATRKADKQEAREQLTYAINAKIMFGDECQFVSDARYQRCIEGADNADIRVLMSGTPWGGDAVERGFVQGYGGPLLAEVAQDELIIKGISAKPNVMYFNPKIDLLTKTRYGLLDYRDALYYCTERNQYIAAIARAFVANGLQMLIFTTRVEHALEIQKHIPEATVVHGSASDRKRTEKKIRNGDPFACICTAILDTGLDTPFIQGIVYAGAGPDLIRLDQTVGRLLRQNETKDKSPWFFDFRDEYHKILKRQSGIRHRHVKLNEEFNLTDDLSLLPTGVYNRFMQEISQMGIHG